MTSSSTGYDDITTNDTDGSRTPLTGKPAVDARSNVSVRGEGEDPPIRRFPREYEDVGTSFHREYRLNDGSGVTVNVERGSRGLGRRRPRRRHSLQDISTATRKADEPHHRDISPPPRSILKHRDEGPLHEVVIYRHGSHGGSHYDHWHHDVVFSPDDAIYRPRRWREKLEILEAKILVHSAQPDSRLHAPISPGHPERKLAHIRHVLSHLDDNLTTVEEARFCSKSFNILVVDPARHKVVNLTEVPIVAARRYVWYAVDFIDGDEIGHFHRVVEFLRYSSDFLASLGLTPEIFEPWRGPLKLDSHHIRSEWHVDAVEALLLHAMRAVAYVLDIGLVSFVGAHLEPFDEAYFHPHRFEGYRIPCDPDTRSTILLSERRFRCLDGFLGSNPAWVFEVHESGMPTVLHRDYYKDFYLSTTPEQFANVWGPIWRAEAVGRRSADRFMVVDGFIVRWYSGPGDPELLPGEYLCHWTDRPHEVIEAPGFPRYVNIDRFLIGAGHGLSTNRDCPTSGREILKKLVEKEYLRYLGPHPGGWYLGSTYVPVPVSHSRSTSHSGVGNDLPFKRRTGVTCRSNICSSIIASPLQNIAALSDHYGVEISGCTGNARRRRLSQLLSTSTMNSFLAPVFPWVLDYNRWTKYCSVILLSSDYKTLRKSTTSDERRRYEKAIRLSIGILKDLDIPAGWNHADALFSHHGHTYYVRLPAAHARWLGLFTDNLTSFSALVVESSCLESIHSHLDLFCHHPGRNLHWNPSGTVLDTTLVLNPHAHLPDGLKDFAHHHQVTKEMIKHVPVGSVFDLGAPAGHLRVVAKLRLRDGWGFVVERCPPLDFPGRTVKNFVRRVSREIPQHNVHSEQFHEDASPGSCIPILVVSRLEDESIAHWLRSWEEAE